ncbi:MAG: hypothetical protein JRJ62_13285 [Deltaproteobacteria bacterium]|nr:hypothetical protein [Deltaproteobacteria bacterium]
MKVKSSPSITRVHTLYRIKSIVNHVNSLQNKKISVIDDHSIADHLIKTHLSKPTKLKENDQIGRRARDHLETARYLGLLYRIKVDSRKYSHKITPWGSPLLGDLDDSECPGNILEESMLIDRVLRFKLSNTSYSQTGGVYINHRQRPCLSILAALVSKKYLNLFEIGYILNEKILDVFLSAEKLARIMQYINSRKFGDYISRLNDDDIKNIRRDVMPLIDWMIQLKLCTRRENDVSITQRGKDNLERYSVLCPVWWQDLGTKAIFLAASIIVSNFIKINELEYQIKDLTKYKIEDELFITKLSDELNKISLGKQFIDSSIVFDFSLHYDVPPDLWPDTMAIIKQLLNYLDVSDFKVKDVISGTEYFTIYQLKDENENDAKQSSIKIKEDFKLKVNVPTASILEQFQSPFEATTYISLKQLENQEIKILKYQAQIAEYFINNKWQRLASSNPDIIALNEIINLIECKSAGEWGDNLSLNKKVISEIHLYNDFASAVEKTKLRKRCKVIFSYEGSILPSEWQDLDNLLKTDYPRIYIVPNRFLQKCLVDRRIKNSLRDFLLRPHRKRESHVFK